MKKIRMNCTARDVGLSANSINSYTRILNPFPLPSIEQITQSTFRSAANRSAPIFIHLSFTESFRPFRRTAAGRPLLRPGRAGGCGR